LEDQQAMLKTFSFTYFNGGKTWDSVTQCECLATVLLGERGTIEKLDI
jgi:hypothetical protein